jgi:hypothetical protein
MRRHRQVEDQDWIDSVYKAYLAAIGAGAAIFYLSPLFGTGDAPASTIREVMARGPGIVGVCISVLILIGLRSGARGGPLAPEPADVGLVLLAPLRRPTALRSGAFRQARGVAFVGGVVGLVAGTIAFRRLPGSVGAWLAVGIGLGVLVALTAWGAALVASGTRLHMRTATAIGAVLVGWAAYDAATSATTSPATQLGRVALWPIEWSPEGLLGIALAIAVAVAGLAVVGGVSIERAQRRAGLVGELRFAATIQDVRTVMVLHRQLAQEQPRRVPWRAVRAHGGHLHGCWRRDWQGLARWPASRVLRGFALGIVTGLALAGAWRGAPFLVIAAAAAFFIAALDANNGLGEEADHLDRPASYPVPWGSLILSHLAAPAVVLSIVGLAALATFALCTTSAAALGIGAISLVGAVAVGIVGSAAMVVLGAPSVDGAFALGFPEFAGLFVAARQLFPGALVAAALLPVALGGHGGPENGRGATVPTFLGIVVVTVGIGYWLRSRELRVT